MTPTREQLAREEGWNEAQRELSRLQGMLASWKAENKALAAIWQKAFHLQEAENKRLREALEEAEFEMAHIVEGVAAEFGDDTAKGLRKALHNTRRALTHDEPWRTDPDVQQRVADALEQAKQPTTGPGVGEADLAEFIASTESETHTQSSERHLVVPEDHEDHPFNGRSASEARQTSSTEEG